jgi:flagella basal body P-ring formation protein FlgA
MNRILLLALLLATATAAADGWQDIEQIRAAALDVARQNTQDGDRVDAIIDERVQLAQCGGPLQAFKASASSTSAMTIGVGCDAPTWKIYVPVRISAVREVIVAARPLARGITITPDMLRIEKRDLSSLPYGYVARREAAAGQQLTRAVADGAAIAPADLAAAAAIRRGQQVVLVGRAGGLEVRAQGKALADAAVGQRVSVENFTSRRVVEGTVRSGDVVDVGL